MVNFYFYFNLQRSYSFAFRYTQCNGGNDPLHQKKRHVFIGLWHLSFKKTFAKLGAYCDACCLFLHSQKEPHLRIKIPRESLHRFIAYRIRALRKRWKQRASRFVFLVYVCAANNSTLNLYECRAFTSNKVWSCVIGDN